MFDHHVPERAPRRFFKICLHEIQGTPKNPGRFTGHRVVIVRNDRFRKLLQLKLDRRPALSRVVLLLSSPEVDDLVTWRIRPKSVVEIVTSDFESGQCPPELEEPGFVMSIPHHLRIPTGGRST